MTHTPKERFILFSTAMVQAILEGRKTQTRRIVKPQLPIGTYWSEVYDGELNYRIVDSKHVVTYCKCPYGQPGDLLWVKETYAPVDTFPEPDVFGKYLYKSMGDTPEKWKPSIFMPKEAARIWLRITGIRVERVQGISEQDAVSEGIYRDPGAGNSEMMVYRSYVTASNTVYPYISFKTLWQSINGQESWDANPWVWVIEFEVISKNGKPCK